MALRELFAYFGIDVDTKKLEKADKQVDGFWDKLQKLGPALAGGALGAATFAFAEHISEIGSAIEDNSKKLGISTDAYQEFGYAAKATGASVEDFAGSVLVLQDKIAAAASGNEEAGKAFAALGVKVKDANGHIRDSEAVWLDGAEAIFKMKDPAKQTAAAMDLFGRGGRNLLPLLKQGTAGVEKLRKRFKELGGGFSEAAVAASDDFGDALDDLVVVSTSAKGSIAVVLLPVLQRLVEFVTKVSSAFLGWVKNSSAVETAVGALAVVLGVLAVKAAIIAAPVLAAAAAFATLFLLVEDIVTLFQGGESVVGEFIDKLFGVGTAAEGVKLLKDLWVDFKDALVASLPAIREVFDKVKWLVEKGLKAYGAVLKAGARIGDGLGDLLGTNVVDSANEEYARQNPNAPSVRADREAFMARVRGSVATTQTVSAPMSSGGASMNYSSAPVINMSVNGGDPAMVKQVVREALDEHAASTYDDLSSHAEAR